MADKKKILSAIIPVVLAVCTVIGLAVAGHFSNENTVANTESVTDGSEAEASQDTLPDSKVSLVAVGDNLIHNTVIDSGKKEDGSYNYDGLYENFKKYISTPDIAVINQETMLGGSEFDYTGYPLFNSPWEVGEAAIDAGFDIFTCATNHSMDKGSKGIEQELKFFEKHPEVVHVGTNASEEDYNKIVYYEKNSIKFAILNYTSGTNGISLPDDKQWIVNIMDKDKIKKDVEEARKNADIVIAFPHWGTENSMTVSDYQKEYAQYFCSLGVDIIIGTHPHVLEPVEWITDEKSGNKTLVYYSIGNFVSHQTNLNQLLGGMAEITVERKDGNVQITTAKLCPIVCHYYKEGKKYKFSVYKLSEYSSDLASKHSVDGVSVDYFTKLAEKTIASEFLDLK